MASSDRIQKLTKIGQSLWFDNIQRKMLLDGEIADLIARGEITGMTSNPTIFNNAISKSNDYDESLIPMAWSGWKQEKIFWHLAIQDIITALDLFRPLYDRTKGADGFVSLEINPFFAANTETTLSQVRNLWLGINRPNLMIKIPATVAGLPAIRQAIADGININITLIFSIERYKQVMRAFLDGIQERVRSGLPINQIASVASFFVSRLDSKIDPRLPENSPLRGKAAIANTRLAYQEFLKVFQGEEFNQLKLAGCQVQRPLWASTSTKNPAYPDTMYVDELIARQTVNTVPPATLIAFRDHGKPELTIAKDLAAANRVFGELRNVGIDIDDVTRELEDEGVKAFSESYETLMETIETRRLQARSELGDLHDAVEDQVNKLEETGFVKKFAQHNASLWSQDPAEKAEVGHRLGWLSSPEKEQPHVEELLSFAKEVSDRGFTHAILLGMGGSSLCPEVFSKMFADQTIHLSILDTTNPIDIKTVTKNIPLDKTLFIVASKSGGTSEVVALFNYFWEKTNQNGNQFIAITDPGTSLEELAKANHFNRIFLADPDVGGRYSALTSFGLIPAALIGMDLNTLLEKATHMQGLCGLDVEAAANPGIVLGVILGEAAKSGRDKLTILADSDLKPFGAWLEQLVAESSGKDGKGILPVYDEPWSDDTLIGRDRLFIYLRHNGELDEKVKPLRSKNQPVITFGLDHVYDLGGEFYRWEMAVAVACHLLGLNAFNQPDVQDAKDRTRKKIREFLATGKMDTINPAWDNGDIQLYSNPVDPNKSFIESVSGFLKGVQPGNFIAINAFVPNTPDTFTTMQRLRLALVKRTQSATTLGFGPRYLHSTGQFHKGGTNSGYFLMFTYDPQEDLPIPGQELTFGSMQTAQALGDYEALTAKGRKVLRIHMKKNIQKHLEELTDGLSSLS